MRFTKTAVLVTDNARYQAREIGLTLEANHVAVLDLELEVTCEYPVGGSVVGMYHHQEHKSRHELHACYCTSPSLRVASRTPGRNGTRK